MRSSRLRPQAVEKPLAVKRTPVMTAFELAPYIGSKPVLFGLNSNDVRTILGPPDSVTEHEPGKLSEYRNGSRIGYEADNSGVAEISLWAPSTLMLNGSDVLQVDDFVQRLMSLDPEPRECVDFLIFFKIGVAVTGYEGIEEKQRTINVFRHGVWDHVLEESVPYVPA